MLSPVSQLPGAQPYFIPVASETSGACCLQSHSFLEHSHILSRAVASETSGACCPQSHSFLPDLDWHLVRATGDHTAPSHLPPPPPPPRGNGYLLSFKGGMQFPFWGACCV